MAELSNPPAGLLAQSAQALNANPERAQSIRQNLRAELERLDGDVDSLFERLAGRRYSPENRPPEPVIVFSVGQTPVSTSGNVTTISAPVKAGKTSAVGAMLAATFAAEGADCLGFQSRNPDGLAVLHIDTEQSPFDHYQLVEQVVKRARREAVPDWLLSYCVTGFRPADVRHSIRLLVQQAEKRFKGVLAILIDGIADGARDVNDAAEANGFVTELHALAIEFHCAIICVIHLNPGSDFKMRGHLGSQLERKAETNLRLEKDTNEVCTLWANKNRRAGIPRSIGPRFAWDLQAGMHVSVESRQQSKDKLERKELENLFAEVLPNRLTMSFTDLRATVSKALTVGNRTAERKIARAVILGIVVKTSAGLYKPRG